MSIDNVRLTIGSTPPRATPEVAEPASDRLSNLGRRELNACIPAWTHRRHMTRDSTQNHRCEVAAATPHTHPDPAGRST